ncbi:MAG: hypothetical protein LKJ69_11900 [Lactobacillus sp.]|nr:hypothetical protein [Lactobacillus sp.]MCI2034069.1 hypothetical protein [Lactobacillus sp.]
MNKPYVTMVMRAIQAAILAFFFWIGEYAVGWSWLVFLIIPTVAYAVICLIYAIVLWRNAD